MKSPAVVFSSKEKVEFGEVDVPPPGESDVVVRTKYSWISNGTESSFLRCERSDGITPWLPSMPLPYPMVPGYQKVGIVEEVGVQVNGLREGDWVFAATTKTVATYGGSGGHVLSGPVDVDQVLALPGEVDYPTAKSDAVKYSGLVLTQVGYNAGSRPPVEEGCSALVVGDGMVGQWSAQTLQWRGARVALVGKHDFRLGLFADRDGDLKLKSQNEGWLERALDWAGGEFDIVVDTVGNDVNYDLNLKLLSSIRREGHYVTAGHEGHKAQMDLKDFIRKEITLHCPSGWTRPRLEKTMELVHSGDLKTLPLITHRIAADRVLEAWERILGRKDSTLGVILEWD
jgi:2-desacetyl-2-hydroxyethyl bacteriochlorophyllide A dehydrogenase